jgi:tripartite-type tricarboxylate transporter receptor subunit TctC
MKTMKAARLHAFGQPMRVDEISIPSVRPTDGMWQNAAAKQLLIGSAFLLTLTGGVCAQDYPSREFHSVVNFGPGSGMDITIRYYAQKLTEITGKPVIVDNKPGATGNIATEYLIRSKPDGYTFMITPASSTLAAASAIFKKLPFDPLKDLQPVMLMHKLGFVFIVNGRSPVKTVADLTDYLKKKPGHGAYGTGANTGVVAAELYKTRAGLETNQVLYRGVDGNMNDLLGGQLDFATFDPTSAFEFVRTGKVRAIAVSSATRLGSYPDVPTMAESGFPGYDLTPWLGLVVPAGTPKPIVEKLAAWHRQIDAMPETKKAMAQFGYDPLLGDADAMTALLKKDIAQWAEYVRIAKIQPQ